jgi:hypothetical protein
MSAYGQRGSRQRQITVRESNGRAGSKEPNDHIDTATEGELSDVHPYYC